MRRRLVPLLLILTLGCSSEPELEMFGTPAGQGASAPFISSSGSELLLSWIEPVDGGLDAVRFAKLVDDTWSEPVTIVERDDLFVNWADFPSVVADDEGVLFAHWLQRSAPDVYAYDVVMSISRNGGGNWGDPFKLNRDGTPTEHGFVSLASHPEGGVLAVWLDGREMSGEHGHGAGDMTLRTAHVEPSGLLREEELLDQRTCECCATGMALVSGRPLVAYRDRSEREIRDVAIVRKEDGRWTEPSTIYPDQWFIDACPVNGPQVDAFGNRAVVAWFTGADGKGAVKVVFSSDGGETFTQPLRVDQGEAIGRVDTVMLDDQSALVAWIEGGADTARIMVRVIDSGGGPGSPIRVVQTNAARASGFPRLARTSDDSVWLVWTDVDAKTLKMVRIEI